MSKCVVGNGKRIGKGFGASLLCCWGQCLKPGAGSHFLPHRGSVTGSHQSLRVASCQEACLCLRLSSPSPAGRSLPWDLSHWDNWTDQGVQFHPVLKSLQGRAKAADLCHHPTCWVSHSIIVPDLLPGEGPQVKLSISTASPLGL